MPVLLFFGDILCFSGAGRREPREAKYNMSMKVYQAGIDIGSTTVKLVVTDEEGRTLFSDYRRHCARTQETPVSYTHLDVDKRQPHKCG